MADFIFVLKCAIVTVAIVVLLQIRIGQRTIEAHTMTWLHRSAVSQHLQDVAEGAVKVGGEAKRGVASLLGSDQAPEPEPQAEASQGWFKIKRSAAYHRQKAREEQERTRLQRQREENEKPLDESGEPLD